MIPDLEDSSHEAPAVWADGERTVQSREDAGDFIVQFKERWGFKSVQDAMSAIAEVQEELQPASSSNGAEKARELFQRVNSGLAWLIGYTGDPKMAACVLALRLGFNDVAGSPKGTAVEVARTCSTEKHTVGKATVNKCIRSLESFLNGMPQFRKLPPLPSQRSDEARENMRVATEDGWKKKPQ